LPELKETKNAYGREFRLISVPSDLGEEVECVAAGDNDEGKQSSEKYYGTSFRTKQEGSGRKTMSLLWEQESGYWKIIAIHIEDSSDVGILPEQAAATAPTEEEPKSIFGDPDMVKTITDFYQTWIVKRQGTEAFKFVSQRSYQCLGSPFKGEESLEPAKRIVSALDRVLKRVATGNNLSNLMSGVQPVNDLLRPVTQADSQAFAIMAVPDQKADSFLCQNRHLPEKTQEWSPDEATYGTYYLSASRLNFGEEQSPALLLLWTKEQAGWKIVAWAVEVP
jgi:hypothetical protein